MKRLCYIALACFLVFSPEYRLNAAEEQTVTPTLERVAMFKNGYIIVQQIIDIPAPQIKISIIFAAVSAPDPPDHLSVCQSTFPLRRAFPVRQQK